MGGGEWGLPERSQGLTEAHVIFPHCSKEASEIAEMGACDPGGKRLQVAAHFPQVQSTAELSKQKDVMWLLTKSNLQAACLSPLSELLCMPPDG